MKHTPQEINLTVIIPPEYANQRFDQALAKIFPQYSRSRIQTWIRQEQVLINGKSIRAKDKVCGNEEVIVHAVLEAEDSWTAEPLKIDVIYEDDALLVINKAAGMVVHPAAGNRVGTLLNALLHHFPPLSHLPRAGIIHRLDKDTTGLLVIAKTLSAHTNLVAQLQQRLFKREYLAVVTGTMTAGGTVNAPIGRHPKDRLRMAVTSQGKPAVTHYRILERFRAHTALRVMLETGRTHQIRVHCAHIHHPLLGDPLYGQRLQIPAGINSTLRDCLRDFKRQALHAASLELTHPTTQNMMSWQAPIPQDLQQLLNLLRADISSEKS